MSQLIKYVSGIDIAKDKFDVCLMSVDDALCHKIKGTRHFPNTPAGFKDFLAWSGKHCREPGPMNTVMEASGVYHERLALFLTEKKLTVSIILPTKARRYMQALGLKSKNDTIDAKGIALMGIQLKLDPWTPAQKFYWELRLLTRHYQSTQETRTCYLNQLHALDYSAYASKEVKKQLEKTVALFDKQLEEAKGHIAQKIESHTEAARKVAHITKINGINVLTIATLLAETGGFALFSSAAQLVSYAGYDVVENQSGLKAGKTRISKKGNSHIRRALHMPALTAIRCDEPAFVNLYQRVYDRTKIKMKAYVAVQKKLLTTIYALWKNDTEYQSGYSVKNKIKKVVDSGNEELRPSLPLVSKRNISAGKKKIVPPEGSTTQDKLQYNESPEAFFPLTQT